MPISPDPFQQKCGEGAGVYARMGVGDVYTNNLRNVYRNNLILETLCLD